MDLAAFAHGRFMAIFIADQASSCFVSAFLPLGNEFSKASIPVSSRFSWPRRLFDGSRFVVVAESLFIS